MKGTIIPEHSRIWVIDYGPHSGVSAYLVTAWICTDENGEIFDPICGRDGVLAKADHNERLIWDEATGYELNEQHRNFMGFSLRGVLNEVRMWVAEAKEKQATK